MKAALWPSLPFEAIVLDASGGNNKVQKNEYLPTGTYPIVDQGQELVGGYSDDETNLVSGAGPWVVFGDHTRAVKFLDAPFCMGADGVKVLLPRDTKKLDARFLYWFLVAHPVPSAGYSRHYKFLKRLHVPLPPLDEQRRIAAILDKADALRQKRKRALALLDSLTQSIFLEMFGDPIQNPNGFATVPLEQIISPRRPITYGILMPGADLPDGVPYVRVVDIQRGKVLVDQLRRTSAEIDNDYKRSRLKRGDLLISIRGHVGRMATVPHDAEGANITQDTARLAIDGANAQFVMAALTADAAQHWMFQRTKGAAVRGINLGDLRKFPMPLPPRAEQEKFAKMARAIEKLSSDKHAVLALAEQAFASLQHRAFSGQL